MVHESGDARRDREVIAQSLWFSEARFEPIPVGIVMYNALGTLSPDQRPSSKSEAVDIATSGTATLVRNGWFELGSWDAGQDFEPWAGTADATLDRLRQVLLTEPSGPRGIGLRRTDLGAAVAYEVLHELPGADPEPTLDDAIAVVERNVISIPHDRRVGEWFPVALEQTEHYAIVMHVCWDPDTVRTWETVMYRSEDGWKHLTSGGVPSNEPGWYERPVNGEPVHSRGLQTSLLREPKLTILRARTDHRVARLRVATAAKATERPVEPTLGFVLVAAEGDQVVEVLPISTDGSPVVAANGSRQRIVIDSTTTHER